jgi:hypothetical protein
MGWYMNAEPVFEPVEILITRCLFPHDRYYQLQQGGGSYCTQGYFDQKREEVTVHEFKHHSLANEFWGGGGGRSYEAAVQYLPRETLPAAVASILQAPTLGSLDSIQKKWDVDDQSDITCLIRLRA